MLDNTILKNNIIDSALAAKNAGVINQVKKESPPNTLFSEMLNNSIKPDKEAEKRKLMDACHDLEAIFISKMLKEMRKSIGKSEWLHGGFAQEIFEDMLYDEYSQQISRNSNMGLAKMLYDEMSKKL
ncbi:MAG: rod-binding protein [Leptospirales bacterium]|nr:rod-binding protein [Leptospirales bacterium]